MNPFDYNFAPTGEMIDQMNTVRAIAKAPAGRERSLAMTNLEQAIMWANKAICHAPEA